MVQENGEVVIVGGRVFGCATAFWLAKPGLSSLLHFTSKTLDTAAQLW